MKKFLTLFFSAVILTAAQALAQGEICNNGLDDDGDGFIDCYDNSCVANSFCKDFFLGPDPLCEVTPSAFPKFNMVSDFVSPNETTNHLGRVVVGDMDGDGVPEIVTVNRFSKRIFILSGKNGSILKSVTTSFNPGYEEIAIANINNGNGKCAEVFVIDTGWRLYSYDCNLNLLWGPVQLPGDPGMYGLADFNGDGQTELYVRDAVYNAHTGAVIVPTEAASQNHFERRINGGPVAADLLDHPNDPSKNLDLELVVGCKIYSIDVVNKTRTLQRELPEYFIRNVWNSTSIADFNRDGYLDVIASGSTVSHGDNTTVFFWDVRKSVTTGANVYQTFQPFVTTDGNYTKGWGQGTGRINIADLDGDDNLNLSFVSGKYLFAVDHNMNLLWRKVVSEETSGYTGCTLFDFNGDSESEIVYRDERFLYILNGTDGSIYSQQACVSRTNREYPVVADVDADGQTELCVTCRTVDFFPGTNAQGNSLDVVDFNTLDRSQYSQVRVFRTAADPWVPARRVWNQHGYFNVNINDDLTIPIRQQKHHLVFSTGSCTVGPNRPLNGFLNQSPFLNIDGCPMYKAPDLAIVDNSLVINPPTCPDKNFTVSFQFQNQGDIGLSGTLPITFYNGDPRVAGATKLSTININLANLAVGNVVPVSNVTITGTGGQFDLYIAVNDGGTTSPLIFPNTNFFECNYDKNILMARVNPLPVALETIKIKDHIYCAGSAPLGNGAAKAYVKVGAVRDSVNYQFYWSKGNVVKPVADYTGYTAAQLLNDNYQVFALHKTANCTSDTSSVTIGQIVSQFNVRIDTLSALTNCKNNRNGHLQAVVLDKNNNAVFSPTSFYNFSWYEGNDYENVPVVSTARDISQLSALTYTVLVTEKSSGCRAIESATVPDNTVIPSVSTDHQDITCSNANTGRVWATVDGVTTGYKFEWYNGNNVKPTSDFVGDLYQNLTEGPYTVVATNTTTECSSLPVKVIIAKTIPPAITITKTSDQISCDPNAPTGSATVTVTGNVTDYNFEWYNGQTTASSNKRINDISQNISGLKAGTYTVKVTDKVTGCLSTAQVTILDNIAPITITTIVANPNTTCVPNNGRAEVTLLSQDQPSDYTYRWVDVTNNALLANSDALLENVPAGVYSVIATHNVLKCISDLRDVTILDNIPSITVSATELPASTCNLSDGAITVTASSPGNTTGFDFAWTRGSANGPIVPANGGDALTPANAPVTSLKAGLPQGGYTVVITNRDNGCKIEQQNFLESVDGHSIQLNQTPVVVDCSPAETTSPIIVQTINTIPTTTYEVYLFQASSDPGTAGTLITSATNIYNTSPTVLQTTDYTIVAVAMNGVTQGCRAAITTTIKQNTTNPVINANATAAAIINNSRCNVNTTNSANGAITVNVDGSMSVNPANYQFTWYTAATNQVIAGETNQLINDLKPGTYRVDVMYSAAAPVNKGCVSTQTFTVLNIEDQLMIDMANGDLVVSPVLMCDVNEVSPRPEGSASFTNIVLNANVNVPPPFTDYSFSWFKEDNTALADDGNGQPWDRLQMLAPGEYYVQAKNNTSNCDVMASFTIEDKTKNTVGVDLISFQKELRCVAPDAGNLQVAAYGTSTTGYRYSWFNGSDTTAVKRVEQTDFIDNLYSVNLFTVKVKNRDNNCIVTDTYTIPREVNPIKINANSVALTNCDNIELGTMENASVVAAVLFGGLQPDGSPNIINQNNFNFIFAIDGVALPPSTPVNQLQNLRKADFEGRTITVKAVDRIDVGPDAGTLCSSETIVVPVMDERVYPPVIANQLIPVSNCDPLIANGTAAASVNGDVINYFFDWYEGNQSTGTSFLRSSTASDLRPYVTPDFSMYTVKATDLITGCTNTDTVKLDYRPVPVTAPLIEIISMVTSCVDNNGALAASVNNNISDYYFDWFNGPTEKLTADFRGVIYDTLAAGTYSLVAVSKITGCRSPLVSENIISDPVIPDFNFTVQPATCGEENGFAALFMTNEVTVGTIEWIVNGATVTGPYLSSIAAGVYTVTVTTTLGCSTTKDVEVKTEIHPFNGVSRNGDGKNDIFYINCIESYPGNSVKIFNRAGTMVYEASGYDNFSTYFDGKSNKGISVLGTDLPDGTYFYIIDKHDGSKPMAGYVEIVN